MCIRDRREITDLNRSEPINFYNILVSDRHDLTLSIISYLLSDRRSDANTILTEIGWSKERLFRRSRSTRVLGVGPMDWMEGRGWK